MSEQPTDGQNDSNDKNDKPTKEEITTQSPGTPATVQIAPVEESATVSPDLATATDASTNATNGDLAPGSDYWTVVCPKCDEETGRSKSHADAITKFKLHAETCNPPKKTSVPLWVLVLGIALGLATGYVLLTDQQKIQALWLALKGKTGRSGGATA